MPSDTAEGFARAFSQAWLMQDTAGLAALFAQDADFLTLTGEWCEGRAAIERVMKAELKGRLRPRAAGHRTLEAAPARAGNGDRASTLRAERDP